MVFLRKIFTLAISLFFVLGFFSLYPLPTVHAEESAPLPEIQLAMIGNALVAIDNTPLPIMEVAGKDLITQEARALEREILFRKLAESQSEPERGSPVFSKTIPQLEKSNSTKTNPSLSALSHNTLFDDFDREVVDPFRSMDNFENFMTRLLDHLEYNIGLYGEYDDNIFLTPDNKSSDFITHLHQNILIQYPMDDFYLGLLYAANLSFYGKTDEMLDTQNVGFQLSYYPFNHLSVGVADVLVKVGETDVASNFGDRTIRSGYITNSVKTELEYEIWENGAFVMSWVYDLVDFSDDETNDAINRDAHTIDTRLRHRYSPVFSNHLGYRFKDVVYDEFAGKDQESHMLFYGMDYKIPRLVRFFGEIGYESKEFKNTEGEVVLTSPGGTARIPGGSVTVLPFRVTIPFEERRRQDNNVNFLVGFESILSRFNKISLVYNSRLNESSRSEFTQYLSRAFGANLRHYVDPKTILFFSLFTLFDPLQ